VELSGSQLLQCTSKDGSAALGQNMYYVLACIALSGYSLLLVLVQLCVKPRL
jgi:hypothetical protein